jgi:hypothetical protein
MKPDVKNDPANGLIKVLARDLAQRLHSPTDSGMFITDDELEHMTGYQVPRYQKQWLADNGFTFAVTNRGKPRVLRAAVQEWLRVRTKQSPTPDSAP